MNRIFRQFFLIALLSVCGVNNGFAVTATPLVQGLGDLDITHFSYVDRYGNATTATNFGTWNGTPDHIGYFEELRQVRMHVSLPAAGVYGIWYTYAHGETTRFGVYTSKGTVTSDNLKDTILIMPTSGGFGTFVPNFLKLEVDKPEESVTVTMRNLTGGNTGTDMKKFKLGYLYFEDPQYQEPGVLSIQKFDYTDTVAGFGAWCDPHTSFVTSDNAIMNFKNNRSVTIKVHLPEAGEYQIAFKHARNGSNTYTISGSTDQCTITPASLACSSTSNDTLFTKNDYIYLTATAACDVDVVIANPNSGYVNMKDFVLAKTRSAHPDYQGEGALVVDKFDYKQGEGTSTVPAENFGFWYSKDYVGNFNQKRAVDVLLNIPAAGKYKLAFKTASENGSEYWASTTAESILTNILADSRSDYKVMGTATGNYETFTDRHGVYFDATAQGQAILTLTHKSTNYANMKDFVLVRPSSAVPTYQGVGTLDMHQFAYSDSVENFGYWFEKDYIGNFSQSGRAVTLKLHLDTAGMYRIKFKTARNGTGSYKISTATANCSVTADGGTGNTFSFVNTLGDENFTNSHYLDLVYTGIEATDADVVITYNSDYANMKDFEMVKVAHVAVPTYQPVGKLSIYQFEYTKKAGSSVVAPAPNFGYWFDDEYIGNFSNDRVVTLKLHLDAAGNYRIKFKTARNGTTGTYNISTATANCSVTADGTANASFSFNNTLGDERFTDFHYIDLVYTGSGATDADVAITYNSNWANMKDFELVQYISAEPTYQPVGKLSIQKFAYTSNNKQCENFGYWTSDQMTDANFIGNFNQSGRAVTLKLHLDAAGNYRIKFKTARNGTGSYKISTATPNCSVTADNRADNLFNFKNTLSCETFTDPHYIDLVYTGSGATDADVVITYNSEWANMKDFEFVQCISAEPTYQPVGKLSIQKFAYTSNNMQCENFGYWTSDQMTDANFIGNFNQSGRAVTLKLHLDAAGNYRIKFKTARNGTGTYNISTATANCSVTADGTTNAYFSFKNTGNDTLFTDSHYIDLVYTGSGATDADVVITYNNAWANMKDFELVQYISAEPTCQGVGELSIQKFAYAGSYAPRENFGYWVSEKVTPANYIGNFSDKRTVTILLDIPHSGAYRIKFNAASSNTSEYWASTTAESILSAIAADSREDYILYGTATGGYETFSDHHYIYFWASASGQATLTLTHKNTNYANMRNFELEEVPYYAVPTYQSVGDLRIDQFEYSKKAGSTIIAPILNFGYWYEKKYIGKFSNDRVVTLKLHLDAAGNYRIKFKTARNGSTGTYNISTATANCSVTADGTTNTSFSFKNTGNDTLFTDSHYIDLVYTGDAATDADVAITYNNAWANMKDFEFLKVTHVAQLEAQPVGDLSIYQFGYSKGTGSAAFPVPNFGYWFDDEYIGNFSNNRAVTLRLHVDTTGNYRIKFKTARNATGSYTISTATANCSVTADGTANTSFSFINTGSDTLFTDSHYIDLVYTGLDATDVDVVITHSSNNGANMKDFEFFKVTHVAQLEAQPVGDLSIYKFGYTKGTGSAVVSVPNFGYWFDDEYIGNFNQNRVIQVKLTIPVAGDYKLAFNAASTANSTYEAGTTSDIITSITADDNKILNCVDTKSYTKFTNGKGVFFTTNGSGEVVITLQHTNTNYANMKDFVLSQKRDTITPSYQPTGSLNTRAFTYSGTTAENFGYWYNKGYIHFTNGRSCTLHLSLPKAGRYKVSFKSARKDSGTSGYTATASAVSPASAPNKGRYATASTSGVTSLVADGNTDGTFTCAQTTGGEEDFSQDHTILLSTIDSVGNVDLKLACASNTANMTDFTLIQTGHYVEVEPNGGTCVTHNFYSDGDVFGALPTAFRDGYVLKGWYTQSEGGNKITSTSSCTGSTTIFAQWEADTIYKPIKDDSKLIWNSSYAFNFGYVANSATWVSDDPTINGKSIGTVRAIAANETVIIKMAQGYKGSDNKLYDIYVVATPDHNFNCGWVTEFDNNLKYFRIFPNLRLDNYAISYEYWLQDGDRNATDVEFIVGSCSVDNNEYATLYGDQLLINSNIAKDCYIYYDSIPKVGAAIPGWKGNQDKANGYAKYIFGTGYTADHHVKMIYVTTSGNGNLPEFKIGYLKCTYTFNYPTNVTKNTDYAVNQKVQLSAHSEAGVASRKGWEITAGTVGLQNGDTLQVGDMLNVRTRDSIKVIGNATLQGYDPFYVLFEKMRDDAILHKTSKQVEYGDFYGSLPQPTCEGYYFAGWFTDSIGGTKVDSATIVSAHSEHFLYAHWRPNAPMERTTWNPNGITLSIDPANDPIEDDNVSVTIGDSTFQSPIPRVGCNLYKVELPFENNAFADSTLYIQVDDGGYTYQTRIPYMVGKGGELKSNMSLVVPDKQNWEPTSAIKLDTVEIYEHATVTLKADVTVSSLVIRANATANKYPQIIEDGGQFKATKDTFWFDYELDANVMYTFATTGNVAAATLFNLNLRNNDFILDTAYYVDYYDGTQRASTGKGWAYYNDTKPMTPMQGYTIAAEPDVCDFGSTNPIVRMPMAYPSGEKTVLVQEYSSSIAKKEAGWNLLGNPYLCTWYGGHIVADDKGKFRYMTIPTHTGSYSQKKAEEVALEPFHNFFVQSDRTVNFTFSADKLSSAPARAAQVDKQEQSIGIRLSNGIAGDKTEMLLGDAFDDTYEVNADLLKMNGNADAVVLYTLLGNTRLAYHATSNTLAAHAIAVGYSVKDKSSLTFSALDMPDNANYQALILTDTEANKEVNLLQSDYTFTPTALSSNQRFTLRCVPRTIPTNVDADILADYIPEDAIVTVYNTLGGVMKVAPSTLNTLPNGVYIIQVQSGSTARVWKYSVNK